MHGGKHKLNLAFVQMQKILSNLFKSFVLSQSLIRDVVCVFPNFFIEANAQKQASKQLHLNHTKLCVFAMALFCCNFYKDPEVNFIFTN